VIGGSFYGLDRRVLENGKCRATTRRKGENLMFKVTKEEALEHIQKALDVIDSAIDQSQDLLTVKDELVDVYEHLQAVAAEGE